MSTLKTNNVQVGQSATTSNNFTWYQPASPDGTVRLGQGNSGATTGDKITVNSTGVTITGNLSVSGSYPAPFGSGTSLIFPQASAPTGWTKVTTANDYALRIVSGTGGGTGGSVNFTTAFASGNTGAYTLATTDIPSHTHTLRWITSAGGSTTTVSGASFPNNVLTYTNQDVNNSTGGGGSHTHSLSLAVKYVDAIIATKD
jgi:hypothetical protein